MWLPQKYFSSIKYQGGQWYLIFMYSSWSSIRDFSDIFPKFTPSDIDISSDHISCSHFSRPNFGDIKLIWSIMSIFSSSSNMRKFHVPVAERQEQPSPLWSPGYFGHWLPWLDYQDWKSNTRKSSWISGIRGRMLKIGHLLEIDVFLSPGTTRVFFHLFLTSSVPDHLDHASTLWFAWSFCYQVMI